MTDLEIIQAARARRAAREAQARRARRHRRRRRAKQAVGVVVLAVAVGIGALLISGHARHPAAHPREIASSTAAPPAPRHDAPHRYGTRPARVQVNVKLKLPLTSGLLFDVHTGDVMWERDPDRRLPIASLTKMMTALVVSAHASPRASVLITRDALHYSGSGVGLLPVNKRVPLTTLLYGLLLPSGNDAANALADHVAGTRTRFVTMMNDEAKTLGLSCTHYSTVSGIVDQDNYSCASDLAVIAHAVLSQPLLRRIVGSASAVLPFPIKSGKLFLYNNNPLLRNLYPGADGVKTGYTTLAGPCLVASARRGRTWLAVVLLHSEDEVNQATELLNAGFATRGA